ncbi:allantoinase [Sedimentibacter acidaminivorans]|uniref:Allantoinase n=1 Tax=Sedimentibacter acidaminivorans TaxID=913099 RepID=A0ABS4GI27_9FIRM|nr:allantoinase AllB [Sedimentibacter acidaminivorans]MBP1927353.1 allantoinase [Sedimentibacter acidaminivorans]
MYDLIVKNGKIVTEKNEFLGMLAIKDGKVAAILDNETQVDAKEIVDANGKYVLPGMIDAHVHGGHGDPNRETLYNASLAAAAGGITTILEQPLSTPSTVTLEAFNNKYIEANEKCVVDFGLWGGLVPGHIDDIEDMFNAGGQAFKSFMCRCSNYPMTDDGTLLKGMKTIGELGGLVAVHAENDTLIQQLVDDFNSINRKEAYAFIESHPVYSELEAIERFIFIAKQAPKCRAHIVHVSIPQGIKAVKKAQTEGVNITAETCPQYLGLCEDDLYELGGIAKCDPPVRPRELVEELWKLVIDGTVDMIASDHSPHPFERKVVDKDNFPFASEGVTGLQTMFPVILTGGVHERNMSLSRAVEICSSNVARRFGLYPQKGNLDVGSDADFIILDLDKEWVCKAENMHYLNKHTPFDGRTFKGYIEKTYVRGTLVCENNELKVQPGFGEFIKLNMIK